MKKERYFIESHYPDGWTRKIRGRGGLDRYIGPFLKILDPNGSENILEVGCGEGRFIPRVAGKARYVGVDISKRILLYAYDYLSEPIRLCCDLLVAEAKYLPFRTKVFDKSFCYNTIYFIPNQDLAIQEMARVAKKTIVYFDNLLNVSMLMLYFKHLFTILGLKLVNLFLGLKLTNSLIKKILYLIFGEGIINARIIIVNRKERIPWIPYSPKNSFQILNILRKVGFQKIVIHTCPAGIIGTKFWYFKPVLIIEAFVSK